MIVYLGSGRRMKNAPDVIVELRTIVRKGFDKPLLLLLLLCCCRWYCCRCIIDVGPVVADIDIAVTAAVAVVVDANAIFHYSVVVDDIFCYYCCYLVYRGVPRGVPKTNDE